MSKIKITVERAEVRGGKIILVFRPDLLSGQTFAVSPFYDEGDLKNQLQTAHFQLSLTEDHGEIKNVKVDYTGVNSHYTKGHTQIHYPITSFTFDRKEAAILWVTEHISPDVEYWNAHKQQLLQHWAEIEPDFVPALTEAIVKREREYREKMLTEAMKNYDIAKDELHKILKQSI